ncbi:MAG: hypothetical protein ACQGVC_21375 [Myxococcota bacterium]
MIETLLVLGTLALLGGATLAGTLVPPDVLLQAGGIVTAAGLAVGVPTGFWYHVALYRALRPHGPLPGRWWIHPVALHIQLLEGERRSVLRWFVAGGLGFFVVVLGCAIAVLGLSRIVLAGG